ncbi:alpha/beta fold hydrolase [Lacunimicrobium album]
MNVPEKYAGISSLLALWKVPFGPLFVQQYDTISEERLDKGLIVIMPGIEGKGVLNRSVAMGLLDAGVPEAITMHDWTSGKRVGPVNLLRTKRNKAQAQVLVDRIIKYQDEYPGRPVTLIGHSGGGGMTMMTLELLPAGRQIRTAILLAPAVSPGYDFAPIWDKVSHHIHHFYCVTDMFFLGIGTAVFGTMDRRFTVSAGAIGFRHRNDKLIQHPFRMEMFKSWNLAGHFGCTNRAFVRQYLAPLILQAEVESPPVSQIGRKAELSTAPSCSLSSSS